MQSRVVPVTDTATGTSNARARTCASLSLSLSLPVSSSSSVNSSFRSGSRRSRLHRVARRRPRFLPRDRPEAQAGDGESEEQKSESGAFERLRETRVVSTKLRADQPAGGTKREAEDGVARESHWDVAARTRDARIPGAAAARAPRECRARDLIERGERALARAAAAASATHISPRAACRREEPATC